MDDSNISELKDLAPSNSTAKVELLGRYDPEGVLIIRDPYYVSCRLAGAFLIVKLVRCGVE